MNCVPVIFFLKKKVFKTFWAINSSMKLLHISYQSKHIHLFPVNTHFHITHWPLDYIMFVNWNKRYAFQKWFQWLIFGVFTVKLTLDECRWTSLMPNNMPQVMARWHQAPSHYLGQCWHTVRNLLVLGHLLIKRSRTGETAVSYCIQNQVKIHPRSGKSENLFAMSMLANSPRALNNFQMENPNPNPKEEYCQLRWQVVAIFSFFSFF